MKNTLPLLTLAAALLAGCAATVPVKGIDTDRSIEQAKTKAPIGEECAPILSWFDDMNSINGQTRTSGGAHKAFDMVAKIGASVIAPAPGMVMVSMKQPIGGEIIWIYHGQDSHGNQILANYAHLSVRRVQKGDLVKRGQLIGLSGDTGTGATYSGAHLHFGVSLHPEANFQTDSTALEKMQGKSPNLFLFPMTGNSNPPTVPERFPRFDSNTNYGDSNWLTTKAFTGFTFPVSCAGAK